MCKFCGNLVNNLTIVPSKKYSDKNAPFVERFELRDDTKKCIGSVYYPILINNGEDIAFLNDYTERCSFFDDFDTAIRQIVIKERKKQNKEPMYIFPEKEDLSKIEYEHIFVFNENKEIIDIKNEFNNVTLSDEIKDTLEKITYLFNFYNRHN